MVKFDTFSELVNGAIIQEDAHLAHKADEPLEADSWFKTMESKFTLYPYNEGDKAGFAAQQLRGPARTWWDNHMAMFPRGHSVHLGPV